MSDTWKKTHEYIYHRYTRPNVQKNRQIHQSRHLSRPRGDPCHGSGQIIIGSYYFNLFHQPNISLK